VDLRRSLLRPVALSHWSTSFLPGTRGRGQAVRERMPAGAGDMLACILVGLALIH
jgi:hypothetical protein